MQLDELIQFHKNAFERTRDCIGNEEKLFANRFHELAIELLESLKVQDSK